MQNIAMSERAHIPVAHTANIVKRDGVYHLLMLVNDRWLETGITSRKFLEITQIADREFAVVHVDAPLTPPEPAKDSEDTEDVTPAA
ncbi:MAG: hypothetical protein QOE14_2720 [Humisphaera sp.]|nr:hypothetical protein [Humisphaera sp.]